VDYKRFEQLVRTLGEGRSRRGAVGLLGGLGLAVMPRGVPARHEHKRPGKRRKRRGAGTSATGKPGNTAQGRYQTLAAQWWTWVIGEDLAPILGSGAVDCAAGQQGNTWFLAGFDPTSPIGPVVARSCTVPSGTRLFFPVINAFCAELPATFQMQLDELRACATTFLPPVAPSDLTATVDGVAVPLVRAQSALFPLHLGETNPFGAPAGTYLEAADGYWVLLDPLPPGEHIIHFTAGAILDVTYTITVV
jgi:hypothetical protein